MVTLKGLLYNFNKKRNFRKDLKKFNNLFEQSKYRLSLKREDIYPCLEDKFEISGFDTHYVYHLAWASRILNKLKPELHTDLSSSLYFSTIISAFIPTNFYDFHKVRLNLKNLKVGTADLQILPFPSNSIESLSCMHVVEHIGLGRYGDPLDYDGDLKAIKELRRVLSINGTLLFVVPIGKPRIAFNAHRIYSFAQIIEYFAGFKLIDFSLIPDNALDTGIIENATQELADMQNYGCGCFHFKKQVNL